MEGRFPKITFEPFDFNEAGAPGRLQSFAPDVAFAAPSLLPWWKVAASANPKAKDMPFAGWLACNLAPMLKLAAVWGELGLSCPWVGAAYPDVVNAILASIGPAPTVGCGNIAEDPQDPLRRRGGHRRDAPGGGGPLVAEHALEFRHYAAPGAELPPYLLQARWGERDVTAEGRPTSPGRCRFPTTSTSICSPLRPRSGSCRLVRGGEAIRTHAPAPNGLLGGYPIRASHGKVESDLAPH